MTRTLFDDVEELLNESFQSIFGQNDLFDDSSQLTEPTNAPVCWGYVMHIDQNGKQTVKTYGNVEPELSPAKPQQLSDIKEPIVDILKDEKTKEVKLIAEMPGVEKSDIKVNVERNMVHIDAAKAIRKYHVDVPLNYKVQPNTSKANYKNGILELTLKLADEERSRGKPIEIE